MKGNKYDPNRNSHALKVRLNQIYLRSRIYSRIAAPPASSWRSVSSGGVWETASAKVLKGEARCGAVLP